MTNVEDIEEAVERLSPDKLAKFRAWFEQFEAARFDQKIEQDALTGRLDKLARWACQRTLTHFASQRTIQIVSKRETAAHI